MSSCNTFWLSILFLFLHLGVTVNTALDLINLEEPSYEVIKRYPEFELRKYKPHLVAEVRVDGGFEKAGNKAFKLLAGYIFGKNQSVTMKSAGNEKMKMTAPVNMINDPQEDNAYYVQFFMPSKYTKETLPIPNDKRVKIQTVDGGLIAALKYSGTWAHKRYLRKEAQLLKALKKEGYDKAGEPVFARYNSPFSLWFMRRNEVLIPVNTDSRPSNDS